MVSWLKLLLQLPMTLCSASSSKASLSFPLPPVVVAVSPPAGGGHCWFPQFFQNFSGSTSASVRQ